MKRKLREDDALAASPPLAGDRNPEARFGPAARTLRWFLHVFFGRAERPLKQQLQAGVTINSLLKTASLKLSELELLV